MAKNKSKVWLCDQFKEACHATVARAERDGGMGRYEGNVGGSGCSWVCENGCTSLRGYGVVFSYVSLNIFRLLLLSSYPTSISYLVLNS
jgi:hypothetical protein